MENEIEKQADLQRAQITILGTTFATSYHSMYELRTQCLASATGASSHQSRTYCDCYLISGLLLDVPGLLVSTANACFQLLAFNREGREPSATTPRGVMQSKESANKHGEAT